LLDVPDGDSTVDRATAGPSTNRVLSTFHHTSNLREFLKYKLLAALDFSGIWVLCVF
jgi:hypothetical protein